MSSDPIDIEVRDKVSTAVRDKLLNIAAAALEGANSVDKLNAMLDKVDGGSIAKLTKAQSDLEKQTVRNNLSYLAQETALNKAIAAETSAETAAQKLATASLQSEAAQLKAAAAASKVAQASAQAAQATNAFGETEADVAARLGAVGQAGAALAKQQQAIAITAAQATNAETTLARATTASATAAQGAAARYSSYMSALNTIGKGGSSNPTAAAMKETEDAATKATTATAGVTRELIVLGHEAVSGNFSRIPGSLLVLAERTNGFGGALQLLLSFFTPINIAIGVTIGLFVTYVKALDSIDNAQRNLNNTMTLTGGIAGLTIDSYEELAKSVAKANNVTITSAKGLVSELAASGRFQADEIAQLADNAIKLGKLSNTAADEIIKGFIKAQDAPLHYAKTLQETSAAITPLQLDEIKRLDDLGQHAQAARLLQQDLYEFLQNNAPQALGGLSGLWQTLKNDIDGAATAVVGFIRASDRATATNADQQGDLEKSVAVYTKLKSVLEGIGANGLADIVGKRLEFKQGSLDGLKDSVNILAEQAKAASDAAASSKIAAQSVLELGNVYDGSRGNVEKMNKELEKFRTNLTLALNDPSTKSSPTTLAALDNQAAIEASIRRKYAPAKAASTPDENREAIIAKQTAALQRQLVAVDQLNGAREASQKLQEIEDKLATHTKDGRLVPLQALNAEEKKRITILLDQIAVAKRVEAAQESIYSNVAGPLRTLNDGETAITNLLKNHTITAEQAAQAQRALNFAFAAATDPLFSFNRQIQEQNDLLDANLGVKERAARQAVQQINNTLAPSGRKLDAGQAALVERENLALQKRNQYQAEYDRLVSANQGQAEALVTQLNALNNAYQKGAVSQDQYAQGFVQIGLQMNQLLLDKGKGFASFENVAIGAIGKVVGAYKNALSGLTDTFGSFFNTLTDGFANSIGKAIVYGGSLKDSLLDVARQGVSALISSLVKLGIQYVLNAALGTSIGAAALAATTATSVAAAATTAAAWAPAAAAVSLASFGANSIPASEGIIATFTLSEVLSSLGGFRDGGYTGQGGVNDVAGVVHGQEFVVNASATRANRGTLEAINNGSTVGTGAAGVHVSIENYGTSKDFEVQQLSANEVRIIARDEASKTVQRDTPDLISSQMAEPNSKVSKAMTGNYQVARIR